MTLGMKKSATNTGKPRKQFRVKIDDERCKGCDLCVAVCPNGSLVMSTALNARGLHFITFAKDSGCSGCLRCTLMCPDVAIGIEEGAE